MKKILFINHAKKKCGVFQYGLNVFNLIKNINNYQFDYEECSNREQCLFALKKEFYWAVIYNYHRETLPFIDPDFIKAHEGPIHICLAHELTQEIADQLDGSFFHYYLYGDPCLTQHNPRVFKLNRLLFSYENRHSLPKSITIGSYGFGSIQLKLFEEIVQLVEKEFDQAIIRINIPFNDVVDSDGKLAKACALKCQKKIKKPGIQLQITHSFFTHEELLDFLAQNTINIFFYEEIGCPGISSAADFALAAKRPVAVSDSSCFKHFFFVSPSILLKNSSRLHFFQKIRNFLSSLRSRVFYFSKYKVSTRSLFDAFFKKTLNLNYNSLTEIIKNGTKPLAPLYSCWSEGAFKENFKEILEKIELLEKPNSSAKSLNRILDDSARLEYEQVIQELKFLAPKIIKKKIQRANIQQAFVYNAVKKFHSPQANILCVGGYHDTAYFALKKQGFLITNIDPRINMDLNTFFLRPKTVKNSYDLIFSTSVIEHVEDDQLFFTQIVQLLKPGGIGVFTCDFKNDYRPEDYLFPGNFRFYTEADLKNRILPLLKNCALIDHPQWNRGSHDFEYENQKYTFATLVFKKLESLQESPSFTTPITAPKKKPFTKGIERP